MSTYDWPRTLDEAVAHILANSDDESLAKLAAQDEADLIMHHFGWGMGIRNGFGLWHNDALLASCGTDCPDDASQVIIRAVWEEARRRFPPEQADDSGDDAGRG